MDSRESLKYWIGERYDIFLKRQNAEPKPWSDNKVFQSVYFCNVRREDDRVTRFIRGEYSKHVADPMFEYNIILSRFLNWPHTLAYIGYQDDHTPDRLNSQLKELAQKGKIWGGAYVITTHGMKMDKVDYLTGIVLKYAHLAQANLWQLRKRPVQYLSLWRDELIQLDGVGPFLTGQVIADLKNTRNHACASAVEWWEFVMPGPGSIRGLNWFHHGTDDGPITATTFLPHFLDVREWVDDNWPSHVPRICNQDLQNCLCEYDKFMRVTNGTGRSKRRYEGV